MTMEKQKFVSDVARRIADAIIDDLRDRHGFDYAWDGTPGGIQQEIRTAWTQIAEDQLRDVVRDPKQAGVHDVERPAERAKRRPANFTKLSAEEQWAIDKELGLLDWDGQ